MPSVPAVRRALHVLELLVEEHEPLTLSEIAARTKIPTASCHAIMYTLQDAGYVTRRSEGRSQYWEPTLALFHLGSTLVARLGIREIALPRLRELSSAVGLPAHLGVLEGADVIYLEKAAAESFIQFNTFPGKRSPFETTALGRAIVANLPDEPRKALLAGKPRKLGGVLADVRERGFAIEDSEDIEGVGCVAAPVFGPGGTVVASIGITGFSRDLFADGAILAAPDVVATAAAVSAGIGHRVPAQRAS
jgi:DNA-binding IclR family transcriptional regulator